MTLRTSTAIAATLLLLASILPNSPVQAGPPGAREADSDNDFGNATAINSGVSFVGNLSSSDDLLDYYKMQAPGAGQIFAVSVYVPSYPSMKVRLVAFAPSGAGIEESAIDSPWQSLSVQAVKSNADYFFMVMLVFGSGGNYVFNYNREVPTAISGGNSFSDQPLSRASDNPGDWYAFAMTGDTNNGLNNDLAIFTVTKSGAITIDVTIFALWTELMAFPLNISLDHTSGGKLTAAAHYPGGGAYYVKVWSSAGNGTYSISMDVLQSAINDDDNDGPNAARINNTPVSSWVDQAYDHYDFFRLYLLKDEVLDVTMTLDTYTPGKYMLWLFHIYGGLYTPVTNASNFVPGTGWTNKVRLSFPIEVSNRYFIIAMAEHGLDAQGRLFSSPANASYTLRITSPSSANHAPLVVSSPGYPVMYEDSPVTPFNLNEVFSEPDGDQMFFNVTGGKNVSARLNGDGSVTLTPVKDWSGLDDIFLRAWDIYNATTEVKVTVQVVPVNDQPKVATPIGNVTVQEDFAREFNVSGAFWDPDIPYGDRLAYRWTGNSTIPMSIDNDTSIITIGPVSGFVGTREVVLYARDLDGAQAYQKFNIIINHTNHPPSLKGQTRLDVEAAEDGVNSSFLARDFFQDRDTSYTTDNLRYSGRRSEHVNITVFQDTRIQVKPDPDWNGLESVFVIATDTGGLTAELEVSVMVLPVNDPPFISDYFPAAPEVTIYETENLTLAVVAGDIDTDASRLTYAWFVDGDKAGNATPSFVFTTDINSSRLDAYKIRVDVSDGELTVSHCWTVPVFNRNQPPQVTILSPTPGEVVKAGELVALRADAFDPEFDKLTYTWKADGAHLGTVRSMKYKFSPGWHNLSIEVYDGTDTTVKGVSIFSDSSPSIEILSPTEKRNFKATDSIKFGVSVYDEDGDPVTFEWRDGGKVLSSEGNFTRKLGTGVHYIRVNASDGRGYNQSEEMIIKIEAVKKSGFLPGVETALAVAALAVAAATAFLRKRRA